MANSVFIDVHVECVFCHRHVVIPDVDREGFERWRHGSVLIQDALPELTNDERETMISRICDRCFDGLFPDP